jgi:hypothetical protein
MEIGIKTAIFVTVINPATKFLSSNVTKRKITTAILYAVPSTANNNGHNLKYHNMVNDE